MAVRFSADGQDYSRTLSLGSQTQWAVACWVKISADRNALSTAWSLSGGGDNIFYLQTASDGTTMSLEDVNAGVDYGARAMTVGTWYYWAAVFNAGSGTVLSRAAGDTAFTSSAISGASSSLDITTLQLGDSEFSGEWLNGCVSAFKLWTGAALTQAELEAEAWTYTPRRTANLTSWHPLARAETTDYSGNARTLSGGSGTATEDGPPIAWRQGRRRTVIPLSIPAEATPGAIPAPWTVPTPAASLGVSTAPSAIPAPWTVPTPSVYVGAPVTSAEPLPIGAPWAVPAPVVTTVKNVTIAPAPIVASWAIPTPDLVVPVNAGDDLDGPGQLSFNGFKMGGGTRYRWLQLIGAGVDLPPIDNGDVDNPSSDGATPGRKLPKSRIISYVMNIRAPKDEIEQVAQDFLDGMPLPEADEELDLAIRIGDTIFVTRGAVTGRAAPVEKNWRMGLVKASVQWTCSDPKLYSRDLLSATVADGATVAVFNAGNRYTRPLIRCPGPAVGPELVIERTLDDGTLDERVIAFDLTVAGGETLVIDPANGTVSIGEASKMRYLTNDSNVAVVDWVLGRGASHITYTTDAGTAPAAVVLWRHAWV